jgi:hypothetical protein
LPPRPVAHCALELVHVLKVAAGDEGAESLLDGELEVAGAPADGALAIRFDEMHHPIVVQLKVHEDAGHGLLQLLSATPNQTGERERVVHFDNDFWAVSILELAVSATDSADGCDQRGHYEHCVGVGVRSLMVTA